MELHLYHLICIILNVPKQIKCDLNMCVIHITVGILQGFKVDIN